MSSRLPSDTIAFQRKQIHFFLDNISKVQILRDRVAVVVGFTMILCASLVLLPCQAADSWKTLSAEVGVDVSIPGKVKTVREGGTEKGKIESYESEDGKYTYTIAIESMSGTTTTVDDVIEEAKKEVEKESFKKSTTPVEASGKQWSGKRIEVSTDDGITLALQVAIDDENEDVVSQTTTAPLNSPEAKRFFDSLQINPEKIKAERTKKTEETLKKFFSPNSIPGWFGLIFSIIGAIVWMIGAVCMIIVAFRTSILWGLALFIPGGIGSLLFIVCNFQRAWPPLALEILGGLFIGAGVALTMLGST